ncbi:hypothetical protein MMC17_001669 [Xylographa soralifera]|nr:hypothetical protein [Xylographa soralifera]
MASSAGVLMRFRPLLLSTAVLLAASTSYVRYQRHGPEYSPAVGGGHDAPAPAQSKGGYAVQIHRSGGGV